MKIGTTIIAVLGAALICAVRMNFEAKRLGGLEVDHRTRIDGTRQRIADYIFFSRFCLERRWALMNRSAKRFDPPGTVARTDRKSVVRERVST